MSKPKSPTPEQVKLQLDDAAMHLTGAALMWLKSHPQGSPIACAAVVLEATGEPHMVAIGDPRERIDALTFMAKQLGDVVGFALVFDGYVSMQATAKSGPDFQSQPRIDAIVSVVRTKWGLSSTTSIAYGYDAAGQFELRPERNAEVSEKDGEVLDGYGVVFGSATVH